MAPGVAFGSYVVGDLIGRGGMAAVYRAEHLLLQKPVALKVMDRALLASAAARQRFLQEGRAAAAIKHPNVVDITDVGVQDGVPYLVMELLEGEDLAAYLSKRPVLDDGEAIRLALPVISALHAAHVSGVVHRDIKPSNIFLARGPDEQLVPKVLDFGISKLRFDAANPDLVTTPEYQIIGTPRYLPPEALRGTREIGPLSDQYSLGAVLYECVTGSTPFAGDTLVSLLNSLSRGTFEPPRKVQPQVSPALDRVILRALSHTPSERFPTIRDMGRALLEIASERTQMVWGQSFRPHSSERELAIVSRGAEPLPAMMAATERLPSEPSPRRSRWQVLVLGACLVLLGALLPAFWMLLRDRSGAQAPIEAVRQPSAAGAAMAGEALPRPSQVEPESVIVGLTPQPAAPAPEATPRAAVRPYVAPSKARRVPSASPERKPKRNASPVSPRLEAAPSSSTASEPTREAAKPEPQPSSRTGANGAPLLD